MMSRRPGGALPPFVKAYEVNGRWVFYFRRGKGHPLIRLRGEPRSPTWNQGYAAALSGAALPATETKALPAPRGSFNAIIDAFEQSPEWLTALKPKSRHALRPSLRYLRKRWGAIPVAEVEPHHVKSLLRGAATGKDHPTETYSAAAHNAMLQALNKVFAFAETELRLDPRDRPTFGMAKMPLGNPDGFHAWSDAEIEQFRKFWPVGLVARLALELLFETGARGRSDVIRLGWKDVGPDKILRFKPKKTDRSSKREVPVDFGEFRSPYLAACLDLVPPPTLARDLPFILYKGAAYAENGDLFGRHFAKWAKAAGLPDHCRAHGVRKAFGNRAANDGATPYEIGAMLGDADPKSVEVYTKARDNEALGLRGARRYKAG
jgi:integrase